MKSKKMILKTIAIGILAAVLLIASTPQVKAQEPLHKQDVQMNKGISKESRISAIYRAITSNLVLGGLFHGSSQELHGIYPDSQAPPNDPQKDSQSPSLKIKSLEGREVGYIKMGREEVQ